MMIVVFWWLALQLIGLLGLPLTMWLFRQFPGRGLAWSKALGLLVVGWAAWFVAMLNLVAFDLSAVLLGCVLLAALSWYVTRGGERGALRTAIRRYWQAYALYELLFGLVLAAGLYLRLAGAFGSAVQYTEKPMELMLLNAVLTSPSFPPHDLWLAGYSLNYYYLGYIFIGALKLLSGAGLGEAFNLGVATIYALTALGVAGLLTTLIQLTFPQSAAQTVRRPRFGTALTALLGVVLVLVAGNQIGALQRIVGSAQVNELSDAQRVAVLVQAIRGIEPRTVAPNSVKAPMTSATLAPMNGFDWWQPSRAIHDNIGPTTVTVDGVPRSGIQQSEVITEFPFFSFYLGDLHPHVLTLPFALLVVALALATLIRPEIPDWLGSWRGRLELALVGLLIGSLYMLNSWDAPTYGFLYGAALALNLRRLAPQTPRRAWLQYGKHIGLVVGAAAILFVPFLLTFDSFAGQDSVPAPFDKIPIIRTLGRIIGPALDHSGWTDLLVIFGLFLVPLLAWWASQVRGWLPWAVVAGTLAAGLIIGAPALAFGPLAFFLFQAAWRANDATPRTFALLLGGLGTLLIFVTDIVYLRDNFDRRFNTVFKVYYQVWLLLALAAAYAVWSLLHSGRWRRLITVAWIVPFALLFAGGLVYPVSVLSPATSPSSDAPRVLDGLAYSGNFNLGARAAADWIAANTPREAHLAGAPGESYGSGGEVATLSGRPTLLGWWPSHENLWRAKQPEAKQAISARLTDLATIYTSPDAVAVRELLAKYAVQYIVLGPNERKAYPEATGATFEQIGQKVHDVEGWAIYDVGSGK